MTYRNIKNNVISDLIYMGDHEFLSQSVNAKRSRMFYSNLNLGISDVAGFGARLNISFDYYESAGEGWSHDLKSVNGSMSVWWNKGPFTISYWRKFPGKYLNGHRVGKDENGDSFDIQYKPDSHWIPRRFLDVYVRRERHEISLVELFRRQSRIQRTIH